MTLTIHEIFVPSVGVEIALDINSLNPYAASSIIYDTAHQNRTIIVAQPLNPIISSTPFEEIHLTTILKTCQGKKRYGIKCVSTAFLKDYMLFDKSKVGAIVLQYIPQLIETNIRSAYRMPLSRNYTIKAKLVYKNNDHYSIKAFSIRDISTTGFGMTIPLKLNKKKNPLTDLTVSTSAVIGMLLMAHDSKQPIATIPLKIEVARIDRNYSEGHIFIGVKFVGMTQDKEDQLNSFIHTAQLDELRRLSRLDAS